MNRCLALLALTVLLLVACGSPRLPSPDVSGSMTAIPTDLLTQTASPTPMGTWEAIIEGVIYDNAVGLGKPIVGASVSYNVLHSYFPELQAGRASQTMTDAQGRFSIRVIVHDTDSIELVVAAPGFVAYEERLVGVDLVGGASFSIGLTRVVTATVSPP
jgi:hypothetical protein